MNTLDVMHWLGIAIVAIPVVLLALFALAALTQVQLHEAVMGRLTVAASLLGVVGCLIMTGMMLATRQWDVPISLGDWVAIHNPDFHFQVKILFDRLSLPFTVLSFVLCGTVGAFTRVYLHREPGYQRFFLFYAMFSLGMIASSLAGTIETLFFGWELVGLSSAFLIAFFHERRRPVINGFRVWCVYRVADAAFLIAALTLHNLTGGGDFAALMGTGAWPTGVASINPSTALLVGLLLLFAAAGKSGLIPFSGWLPRAMEGPTPSSAIFYGALSVHLGAYLLLRVNPLIQASLPLAICVVILGLTSAVFGSIAARVQADAKGMLAYASLTQVGIIVAETGCGLYYIALLHMIGHACLRTLQLLRAPSIINDYQGMANAIGQRAGKGISVERPAQSGWRDLVFRLAVHRGYFDDVLDEYIVRPFVMCFRWCRKMETRWTEFLSGAPSGATASPRSPLNSMSATSPLDRFETEHVPSNGSPRPTSSELAASLRHKEHSR